MRATARGLLLLLVAIFVAYKVALEGEADSLPAFETSRPLAHASHSILTSYQHFIEAMPNTTSAGSGRQQAPPLVRRWNVVEFGQPKQQQQRPPAGHPHREAATSQPKPQPDGRTEAESEHQRQSSVVGGIGLVVIVVCSSCWQWWWRKPAEEEAELQ